MKGQQGAVLLDPRKGQKPLDFGGYGICGSIDVDGGLIALFGFHTKHGYAGLSAIPAFPEEKRYEQEAVRSYRANMAAVTGFGPKFPAAVVSREIRLLESVIPSITLHFADGSQATTTIFPLAGGAIQHWQFSEVTPVWQGKLSVQRAAYTQLTEGGPLPPQPMAVSVDYSSDDITVSDSSLGCVALITGLPGVEKATGKCEIEPIEIQTEPVSRRSITLIYALGESDTEARNSRNNLKRLLEKNTFDQLLGKEVREWSTRWHTLDGDLVLKRALSYGHMMVIPVKGNKDAACIMTDHMLLPLSWNRDAYFVAKALLAWGQPLWPLVRQHLIWMFEIADRGAHNEWGRCYLLNGAVKDGAYQLDQQFFPLLELADYYAFSGDQETLNRLSPHIQPVLDTVFDRKHPDAYLFPTDETPGDDPLDYQYHFSSHILIWHTLNQLQRIFPDRDYHLIGEDLKKQIYDYFVAEKSGRDLFAYATDAAGNYLFYHDANDVPLALAPDWGFCTADDPVWRATVAFAYSTENPKGYFGNHRLGSVHTPAPWPLGDAQLIYIARALKDEVMEAAAMANIHKAAQWDGALSEAYHPQKYTVQSRHWFAWPGALYAMARLGSH